MYALLQEKLRNIVEQRQWGAEEVMVVAQTLSPEEAIGNPEEKDYPILKGRERMMEACFRGARGHAFTDRFGNYQGTVNEVVEMNLANNFRRAIFISTLNAVMRYAGVAEGTVHCKDRAPQECSQRLVAHIHAEYGCPRIFLVGFQPRMAEALAQDFSVRITDLDESNIGQTKFGVTIQDPSCVGENTKWCDLLVVTGSTLVNDTIREFLTDKPAVFYGVTVAGAAPLLSLNRFCPLGS